MYTHPVARMNPADPHTARSETYSTACIAKDLPGDGGEGKSGDEGEIEGGGGGGEGESEGEGEGEGEGDGDREGMQGRG